MLYIGSPHIGGKILHDSVINGYTKIEKDGDLYRSHPYFHKKGYCYDWRCFQWQGFDKPIPASIVMITDLSDCGIIHNMDQDLDIILDDVDQQIIPHLTKEKWVIVLAAESSQAQHH